MEEKFGESGRVAMGRVDCDAEPEIAKRFQITKYPTLKVSLNGDVMKREYREERKEEALLSYVENQLKDPIQIFTQLDQVKNLSTKKRAIIAYFSKPGAPEYEIYRRVGYSLKDDCDFHAGFGEAVSEMNEGGRFGILHLLPHLIVLFFQINKPLNVSEIVFKNI